MNDSVNLVAALQRLRDQYKEESPKNQKELISRMRTLLLGINKNELEEGLLKRVESIEEFLGVK